MVQTPAILIALVALTILPGWCDTAHASPQLLNSPYDALFKDVNALRPATGDAEGPEIVAGIAPHHDLALGVIENFYARIAASGQKVHRVWLLAPDHFRRSRADLSTTTADWMTSARVLEADPEGTAALIGTGIARDEPFLFEREHAVTIHIPAIAHYFPKARVIPVILHWRAPDQALSLIEKAIVRDYRPGDIFILSMDFSHYKTPSEAAKEDELSIAAIRELDWREVRRRDIDAGAACALLLRIAGKLGLDDWEILERTDSAALGTDETENANSCTSYVSILLKK